ncbi:MAG: T9SS type A sorting domain-containing protein [Flavobacteriales bacterium]|nr:T9SS type A sorting domain-containing protein [Flavobacteriales bacterium]
MQIHTTLQKIQFPYLCWIIISLLITCSTTHSQVGSTCGNPETISVLPLTQTGNTTSGFGDDYSSSSACGSSYMNGDDYIYEYSPASNTTINVTLTNTGTYVGVFITNGCPTTGSCVASNTNSGGNPSLNSIALIGGNTYYIIISTWPSPQTTPFDISITEALPILNMIFGTQSVTTCGVDFRDIGGASNYSSSFSGTTTFNPVSAGQKIELNFTSYNTESGYDKVWIYDGPNDTYPVLLSAYSGSSIPVGNPFTSTATGGELTFKFTSDGSVTKSGWTADITCTGVASCDDPSSLSASNIGPSAADLSWTENGSATTWDIELGLAGFSPTGTPTEDNTTANPHNYSGLIASTSYDYYVRADCGGLQSAWIGPFNFTTASCNLISPSSPTATSITSVSASLGWTENGNSTTWDIELGLSGFSPTGAPTANNVTANPHSYNGLSSATIYDFYIRAECNGTNSVWIGPVTFTTASFANNYTNEMTNGWSRGVVQDPSGNYVFAGYTSEVTITAGGHDMYVVKTDQGGNVIWTKTIGGASTDQAFDIVNSGDGGYGIVGHTNSASLVTNGSYDLMITKLDVSGNHIWTRVVGTSASEYSSQCSIIRNPDGTYSITAVTDSDMGFLHLSSSGTFISMRTVNTQGASGYGVTKASGTNGGWVVAGKYQGPLGSEFMVNKIKSDYTLDWSMVWGDGSGTGEVLYAILENSANDYTVFGSTYAEGTTPRNMYAMRFTNSGSGPTVVWCKTYGNATSCAIHDAAFTSDGNYIVTGLCAGGTKTDTYLMKINISTGGIIWQSERPDDGTGNRQGDGVIEDALGSYVVAGLGGFDMLKFAPDGTICGGIPGTMSTDDLGINLPNFDNTEGNSSNAFGVSNASKTPIFGSGGTPDAICNILLPIELLSFTGKASGATNLLYWTTATEKNNDYFSIEKSKNGFQWEVLTKVPGAGNSSSPRHYQATDHLPFVQQTYYRLKQTDFDGTSTYSNVITIGFENESTFQISTVYPNPAINEFRFDYYGNSRKPITVDIINALGQQVSSKTYQLSSENGQELFQLRSLESGVYQILFTQGEHRQYHQLIIQH